MNNNWWCWVSKSGTGSLGGGFGWYLVVLGQFRAVVVDTWWYWISMGQYLLILGGTRSVEGRTG